jgi:hypothetical protein
VSLQCAHTFARFSPWPGLELDACRACGAWLFDAGELARALSPMEDHFVPHQAGSFEDGANGDSRSIVHAPCPRCSSPLREVTWAGLAELRALRCSSCQTHLVPRTTWSALRAAAGTPKSPTAADSSPSSPNALTAVRLPLTSPPPEPFALSRWDLPLIIGAGTLLAAIANPLIIFIRMPVHEFGHAIGAWLSGHVAIPFPTFGFAWVASERHPILGAIATLGLLGTCAFFASKRRAAWALASALALLIQLKLTWMTDDVGRREAIIAGGVVGEFALSALALLCFHAHAPRKWRWDFWRYVVALPAAIVLCSGASEWRAWSKGAHDLPMGGIIGDERDGDLSRLVNSHGWTEALLRDAAGVLSALAFSVLVVAFAVGCWQALRRNDSTEPHG